MAKENNHSSRVFSRSFIMVKNTKSAPLKKIPMAKSGAPQESIQKAHTSKGSGDTAIKVNTSKVSLKGRRGQHTAHGPHLSREGSIFSFEKVYLI